METKHTKEKWRLRKYIGVTADSITWNKLDRTYYQNICDAPAPGGTVIAHCLSKNKEKLTANAKLMVEAGNVTNETGYTPRQLAEQKAKLLEALIRINARVPIRDPLTRKYIDEAIKNATE